MKCQKKSAINFNTILYPYIFTQEKVKEAGLLDPKFTYIEYGAGRGGLADNVCQTIGKATVVLLERERRKFKFDRKHTDKAEYVRVKIDISNFNLSKLDTLFKEPKKYEVVGLAKHLCGGATDLALFSLNNSTNPNVISKGIVVAPCCYHQCDIKAYVNIKFLLHIGLQPKEMQLLFATGMWGNTKEGVEIKDKLNLSKIVSGIKAKSIINYGRLLYLREKGWQVKLIEYVGRKITPENVIFIGSRK